MNLLRFGLLALFFSWPAFSYPQFLAHVYQKCLSCHYDANGGGTVNDYGRSVWATHIAAKPFYNPTATDEELAEQSRSLYPFSPPEWLRGNLKFRELFLVQNLEKIPTTRFIAMKADITAVARPLNENRLNVVLNYGYIPDRNYSGKNFISRAHYISSQISEKWMLQAGFFDIAYGLRIPDHNAFSRQKTLLAQNDQTHGVAATWLLEDSQATLHAFTGNLIQSPDVRLKGASLTYEKELNDRFLLGASVYYAQNDYRKRAMAAVHTRIRSGESSSWLAELGVAQNTPLDGETEHLGNYIFLQYYGTLTRGLALLPTLEYFGDQAFKASNRSFRIGSGLQYFPFQRLELRADLTLNVVLVNGGNPSGSLSATGQAAVSL